MNVEELLEKRAKRAIHEILSFKDRELKDLPPDVSRQLRKIILDQVNGFCELAIDVATSGEAKSFWFNDEYWDEMRKVVRAEMRLEENDGADPNNE